MAYTNTNVAEKYVYTHSPNPQVGDSVYNGINQAIDTITNVNSDGTFNLEGYNNPFTKCSDIPIQYVPTINKNGVDYFQSNKGYKICLLQHESNVSYIFNNRGYADYYILDTENKRFKLPRKLHRELVKKYKNNTSWYNLYSDGWCEQGGKDNIPSTDLMKTLPIVMSDSNYNILSIGTSVGSYTQILGISKTTVDLDYPTSFEGMAWWRVEGYADISTISDFPTIHEYYYVGNFEEPTANQLLFLGHQVIEVQMPTAENNYTWYRKYADGWCEQGGKVINSTATITTITTNLIIPYQDSDYQVYISDYYAGDTIDIRVRYVKSQTPTSFTSSSMSGVNFVWKACGIMA